jgi:hypothetical protein
MFRIFLAVILISFSWASYSQAMVLIDPVTNRPFNTDKYSAVRGTPFLNENWQKGSAISQRGIYQNLELKLDAYENVLYFNKEDVPYEFQENIISFQTFSNGDTLKYLKGISASNLKPGQYVQVLAEGKINFYRSDIKTISEMSEINAGIVKSFITSTRYFINRDGKTELVKLNKDILAYMKDKEDRVNDFMDSNKISAKKEADFKKIITFYNGL